MEFLESKYSGYRTFSNKSRKEYLLELTRHTNAKEIRYIRYEDLKSFSDFLFKTEPSEWERGYAAMIIRKFYRYCIMKGYVAEMPWRPLKAITEDEKELFIKNFTEKKRPTRTPNMNMVMRVGELREKLNKKGNKNSLRDVTKILTKESGKKQHLATVAKWDNVYKSQKKIG